MYFKYKMPHEEHGSRMTKICILFSDVLVFSLPLSSPDRKVIHRPLLRTTNMHSPHIMQPIASV